MNENPKLLIILTQGISDNGKKATIAFSMGLTGLTMKQEVAVFLTSDGAAWGFQGTANGVAVPGFPTLNELIQQYSELGGKVFICSTCQNTCSAGDFSSSKNIDVLECASIVGMATVLEFATEATSLTF